MTDMTNELMVFWIVLTPLLGALLNGFILRRLNVGIVCAVSTLAVVIPFVLSLFLFFVMCQQSMPIVCDLFPWLSLPLEHGQFYIIRFSLVVDRLSSLFLLIITGVGSFIHLYSGEYMSHEKGPYRFFVYLNLFIVSMLLLVLGSNMLVTFLGWEGVGVCSYLLIGYWYEDENNSLAAIKAFIFNRVGDAGFLIAMFLSYSLFKSIDYAQITHIVSSSSSEFFSAHSLEITLMGLCLLLGVAGKSAQIPLYTWLPDAMAGPTPVSALIHAATMVTAGIYLMNRVSIVLVVSPFVMYTIATIGALTALLSATIALAQTDIKKVLAYSTCSQLGYMVMACGVGAFQFGVAHVMTHAFFKACLFLGAGSVIYALHHEQDIRHMGGLLKKMPITGTTFVLATLAIIGFPGFSGFFSKDSILEAALSGPYSHPFFWAVGFVTAILTAFYMFRLLWLVFFGQSRGGNEGSGSAGRSGVRENNFIITLPLIVLGILSVFGGVIVIPELFTGKQDFISTFLEPVLAHSQYMMLIFAPLHAEQHNEFLQWGLMGLTSLVVVLSAGFAILVYRDGPEGGERWARTFGGLYRLVRDKWRVDEFYHAIIVRPLAACGRGLYRFCDRFLIEGVVQGAPETLYTATSMVSNHQSGMARNYIKLIFISVLFFGVILFV
jgi:NADH-quinone oxidoreductase subunit L